jgi:glutamate racemase
MSVNSLPIGILDSGIGGLAVLKQLKILLPKEAFIYFADNKHLPYGEKTFNEIARYTQNGLEFLAKSCKLIVIACNTASIVLEASKIPGFSIPVINMVDPLFSELIAEESQVIGILGTNYTIGSQVYQSRIQSSGIKNKIHAVSAPNMVNMAESLYIGSEIDIKIDKSIIYSYLEPLNLNDTDILILACTHYIHFLDEIRQFYNNNIKIVDGSIAVAKKVRQTLIDSGLLSPAKMVENQFFSSKNIYLDNKIQQALF